MKLLNLYFENIVSLRMTKTETAFKTIYSSGFASDIYIPKYWLIFLIGSRCFEENQPERICSKNGYFRGCFITPVL